MDSQNDILIHSLSSSHDTGRRLKRKRYDIKDLDFENLEALHQMFLDRWNGEDLGLTRTEFKEAIKKTVGYGLDSEEIDRIYSKIDSKDTGLLKWSHYISSLSQTTQLKAYMAARAIKPLFKQEMTFIRTKHRDEIICIRFIPRLPLQATRISYNSGRYLMLGREGTLTMWSTDLSLLTSYFIGNGDTVFPMHFIDMVVLYPTPMVAITATDRKIIMYDIGSRGIKVKYSIVNLHCCVTCMDYWTDLRVRNQSLLIWGDISGDIHALELNVSRLGGIFDKDAQRDIITRVVYSDLLKNKFSTVVLHKATGVHNDWVTCVKYIPENKAFLSSSRSTSKQSLCYSDWYGKVSNRYFLSGKAVLCFDFNHIINFVVTGCLDCVVRVWNFFMLQRPVTTLSYSGLFVHSLKRGHTAPVIHVVFSSATRHVISVDKLHAIKIFDYVEGTVIQSFSGVSLECMGRGYIKGFFFNARKGQLIVATTVVGMATKRVNPADMAEVSAHEFPITAVCYSGVFEEILTACSNAVISVWDVHSGHHMLEFSHYSPRKNMKGLSWAKKITRLEVTAMTLDSTQRCAVTGANDGTVNLWNFSSGVLLAHYCLPEDSIVTALVVDKNVIYATGWCRRVYLLDMDQKSEKETLKFFRRVHEEDINCLALLTGGLVASGSYDGDIIIMTRDTGQSRCRLNAGESQLPIPLKHSTLEEPDLAEPELVDELEESLTALGSNEFLHTEGDSILRCLRISDDKVLVAIKGTMRIMNKKLLLSDTDRDTSKVYDAFNAKYVSKDESAALFRAYENSIDALMCLPTRPYLDVNTASILSAGSEGWIRAWTLHPKGGLKGQFLATEQLGESVKAMASDDSNEFLITGDTEGYIKVWDLYLYCNHAARHLTEAQRDQRRDEQTARFIFLRSSFLRDRAGEGFEQCARFHKRAPPEESNPEATLKTPRLLNVFRSHMQAITCIDYVNHLKLIISGSKDCSVRIWSLAGCFIGHCGDPWKRIPDPNVPAPLRPLPRDILRRASARTFRVIKTGRVPLWERALTIIRNFLQEQKKKEEEEKKAKFESFRDQSEDDRHALEKDKGTFMTEPVLIDKEDTKLPDDLRLCNLVTFNWKDPKKSQILGKTFRPNLHHRPVPFYKASDIKDCFGQIAAFRQALITDISQICRIPTPQAIIDMETRRREEEEDAQKYRQLYNQMNRNLLSGTGLKPKRISINLPPLSQSDFFHGSSSISKDSEQDNEKVTKVAKTKTIIRRSAANVNNFNNCTVIGGTESGHTRQELQDVFCSLAEEDEEEKVNPSDRKLIPSPSNQRDPKICLFPSIKEKSRTSTYRKRPKLPRHPYIDACSNAAMLGESRFRLEEISSDTARVSPISDDFPDDVTGVSRDLDELKSSRQQTDELLNRDYACRLPSIISDPTCSLASVTLRQPENVNRSSSPVHLPAIVSQKKFKPSD